MGKIDEKLLRELIEERDRLLAEHPELVPLQNEITRSLNAAGKDPMARVGKAFEMLSDIIAEEFVPEFQGLKDLLEGLERKTAAQPPQQDKKNKKRRTG